MYLKLKVFKVDALFNPMHPSAGWALAPSKTLLITIINFLISFLPIFLACKSTVHLFMLECIPKSWAERIASQSVFYIWAECCILTFQFQCNKV